MPDSLERKEEEHLRSLLARVPALAQRELTIKPLSGGLTVNLAGARLRKRQPDHVFEQRRFAGPVFS